ncbi:M6 metalloprotease [Hypoxylon trugodes]|uniref:M6 metalloprotease n=1 Tax=Hypoxylon trugodes TaxID=326681 RepID=UPI002195B532|nr:M6 metalloprotease [Hypoxylon trugodes]KAI1385680.1 M6 metalloprotease [Hypoxylon trugodes]
MSDPVRSLRAWVRELACYATIASVSVAATPIIPRADASACKVAAVNNIDLSAGFGFEQNCAPSVGTLNAFMIFVDFSDQPAIETTQSLHDFFLPAAAEWYTTSSYGALSLNVTADTSRFYRMPVTAASYKWDRGLTYQVHQKYIQDALDAYGKTIPPTDVFYVVPTANAAAISFSPTFMGDVKTRAGTHVAKSSVTFGYDAYEAWKYLVLNHETGHTMCLPDYYPLDGRATGLFIGGWDLMGLISGPSPDYFAWDKWRLGWLLDEQIDCVAQTGSTTHTLTPLEKKGGSKAVVIKHNATNVLVAEVRSTSGLDAASCATGVLLYTVSTNVNSGEGPVRVLDATPRSNGCSGDKLNDAVLSLKGTSSYTASEWGVKVTVVSESNDGVKIKVDVS